MIVPVEGGAWWVFVRAAAAVFLIAMAGAFPCCCGPTEGSTSTVSGSTSTSTSTGAPPPLPPRPPGSTSSGPVPLPPIRSSSVGPIQYVDCDCCKDGTALSDQWQVEVAGVVAGTGSPGTMDPCVNCEGMNGVYICDDTGLAFDTQDATGCSNDLRGCQCGDADDNSEHNPAIDCDVLVGADLHHPFRLWRLTAAGAYYSFTEVGNRISRFDLVYSEASLGLCARHYWWEHVWHADVVETFPQPSSCASLTSDQKIPCDSLNGTILNLPNNDPDFFDKIICDVSGSVAVISAVEGF